MRMRRRRGLVASLAVVAMALAPSAWGGTDPSETTHQDFDQNNFANPTVVSNKWTPLVPGTKYVLAGTVEEGGERTRHRVVTIVTDLVKVIDGVPAVVVWEQDISAGELVEAELRFHAQDDDGNVWNLGEYPEEFEDGEFLGAESTWIPGVDGAKAGLLMRGDPQVGTSAYLQGIAPEIDFRDKAQVLDAHEETCVPTGCYDNVLIIDEWNPLEQPQDGHQLKYHAPRVGVVRVEAVGGEAQENLELVHLERLGPKALANVREEALRLDRRAYRFARHVYKDTPPAEPAS
jgi:hypothetical protein